MQQDSQDVLCARLHGSDWSGCGAHRNPWKHDKADENKQVSSTQIKLRRCSLCKALTTLVAGEGDLQCTSGRWALLACSVLVVLHSTLRCCQATCMLLVLCQAGQLVLIVLAPCLPMASSCVKVGGAAY